VRQCICYWKGEQLGRAAEGRASGARPAGGGSQRRKTKGWGPRVIEGEGLAGPSRPRGEGPKGVGGGWRAGRPTAKVQAAGPKPEPGPIQ
jgi:hypothetical protein